MADEFIKGFGMFSVAGLVWMVTAGWYRTPSFESTQQLIAAPPAEAGSLGESIAIFFADFAFWLALVGAFAFWVAIPVGRQAYATLGE